MCLSRTAANRPYVLVLSMFSKLSISFLLSVIIPVVIYTNESQVKSIRVSKSVPMIKTTNRDIMSSY